MSPRKRRCLAFRLREAKKRRKPGRDGKILWSGWRARARGAAKAGPSEHSSVEGILSREKSSPLTRWRWKRFWSHPEGVSALGGCGDRGCQRVIRTPRPRLKTPWRRCVARGSFDRRNHQECATLEAAPQGAGHRARVIRSCRRNVNCAFTRVVRWGLGSVVRDAVRASASLTSRIERSPGARVENRLQKSVRRIFLAAGEGSREALFERGAGSVRR